MPASARDDELGIGEQLGVRAVIIVQMGDEDVFHVGQVNPFFSQQQGDVLPFHIHAEAPLVSHTSHDERLYLVYVPYAGVNQHHFAVVPAQNEQEKVGYHPLTPT